MNKYYYLNIEHAMNGIAVVVGCGDKENIHLKNDNSLCEFISNSIPTYIMYDKETNSIRESSAVELVELGKRTLEKGQAILNGEIVTLNETYEHIQDGAIVKKTRDMLVSDGIEELFENEYLKNGLIVTIPKSPKDIVKPIFNKDTDKWEETATAEEIAEHAFRQSVAFYNSELDFASKATAELACEIITPEMYEDVKSYMKAIDPYAPKKMSARKLKAISRPSVFDRYN